MYLQLQRPSHHIPAERDRGVPPSSSSVWEKQHFPFPCQTLFFESDRALFSGMRLQDTSVSKCCLCWMLCTNTVFQWWLSLSLLFYTSAQPLSLNPELDRGRTVRLWHIHFLASPNIISKFWFIWLWSGKLVHMVNFRSGNVTQWPRAICSPTGHIPSEKLPQDAFLSFPYFFISMFCWTRSCTETCK